VGASRLTIALAIGAWLAPLAAHAEAASAPASAPSLGPGRLPLLVIPPTNRRHAEQVAGALAELARSERYQTLLLAAAGPLLRQADDAARAKERSRALIEEGRQALVALDHALARRKLGEALAVLEKSFVRHYDPRALAEVRVLLGVAALEVARPDLARQEFVEAHHLDPSFKLDAHYSPQVRAAFAEAAQNLPAAPTPPADDLARLARLTGAPVVLVLSLEPAGERALERGALFLARSARIIAVESRLVDVRTGPAAAAGARALGAELRKRAEAHYPLPAPATSRATSRPRLPPPPPPPPRPWYLRWYTLAAVGAAVTAAVVLPIALRQERVGVTARW
jgi:hypothetical protein